MGLRSLHSTQAEVDTHSEVYTPLIMPIISGNAKVKMLSRPYSFAMMHITPRAITVVMVVFGTFVLLRTALDGNFIAAMLTILGYSINDTVVVYDRIRENRGLLGKKASFEELVNHSVNQSARRTIITTVTTVMALGVMCIVSKLYGLDSIFTFAFPLMMGMLSGVYTSLCVSTSAWVAWSERKGAKKN